MQGAPIAILFLSTPATAARHCIFVTAARDSQAYNSREGEIILPDRPHEYPCRLTPDRSGTVVEFENQIGWRFNVRLDRDEDGEWTAVKGGAQLRGSARAL
jgi:hypothetical protein